MDVEINHRNPLQTMNRACAECSNCHVVEQAEPHGAARLGVMARRADGAERGQWATAKDGINRSDNGPGGTQRGITRA